VYTTTYQPDIKSNPNPNPSPNPTTKPSINQSIKTHFYSAICRERIRGA